MSTNHDSGAVDTPLGDIQGFEGAYAESRWTFQRGSGNGFVDKTKLPDSIELTGSNNSISHNTDYVTTADRDGHIMFDWSFSSTDVVAEEVYDGFGYLLNGVFTELATHESSDVVLFDVKAGDKFGFRVFTRDAQGGPGTVKIKNFTFMTDLMTTIPVDHPMAVSIVTTELGWALKKGDGPSVQVKLGADYITDDFGWKLLAATEDGDGYDVYLKNKSSDSYAKWHVDDKGGIVNGEFLSKSQLLEAETSSSSDFDDDGSTGLTYGDDSNRGGVGLGKTQLGWALKKGDGPSVQVKLGADYITDDFGWKLLAATEDGDGYDVYLKNKSSDSYAKWHVDDKGGIVNGEFLSKSQLLEAETSSSSDFDDDGSTGLTYGDDSNRGGVGLGKTQLGWALKKGDGPSVQVKLGADYITDDFGWKLLAATEDGDGYDVYLKNKSSDSYAKWRVDDKGGIVNGEFLSKSQLLEAETSSSSDFDDDGSTGLTYGDDSNRGGVGLGKTQLGWALKKGDGPSVQVKLGADYITDDFGWKLLAATEDGDGYDVYLKNKSSDSYAKWHVDDKGGIVKGEFLSKSQLLEAETSSSSDFDDDGSTGLTYGDDSNRGGVGLGKTQLGWALKKGDGPSVQVKLGADYITDDFGWKLLAATEDGDGYDVYLKNKSSDSYAKWHVDDKGGIVKGEFLSKSQLLEAETSSSSDFDDDGSTGLTYGDDSNRGGVGLGKTQLGWALKKGDGPSVQVKLGADYITDDFGWKLLAATEDGDGYDVYLKNKSSDSYAKWHVDDKGGIVKGEFLSKSQLLEAETSSSSDFDDDGSTGLTYGDDSNRGGVGLGKTQLGWALKKGDGPSVQVKLGADYITDDFGWKLLAATEDGDGYDVYLKNKSSDSYAKWHVDDKGGIVKGEFLSKSQLLEAETSSSSDFDDDGSTGLTYGDDSNRGGVGLGKTQLGWALKKGDGPSVQVKLGADYITDDFGWKLLAATEDGDGYDVYLKNKSSDSYAKWHVDDKGGIVKGEFLSKSQLLEAETSSNSDFDDDGMIGHDMDDGSSDGNMDMVESSESCVLGPDKVHLILTGSANINGIGNQLDNIIDGNVGDNILDGKEGVDMLTGYQGADTFIFSTVPSFGDSVADHITDFDPAAGDRLQISKNAFGISLNDSPSFQTVDRVSELIDALASATTFVYSSSNGSLYFNKNGIGAGFGSGGIFAVLDNAAQLKAANIDYV